MSPDFSPRNFLLGLMQAALDAAQPARVLPPHLPKATDLAPGGRLIVLGAGKAAAAMARTVEAQWDGPSGSLCGLVVTRRGQGLPCRHIEVVEAAHPVPDGAGEQAARRLLALAEGAGAADLVLVLISGGGSALLGLPAPGISLADKQALTRQLLASGAPIQDINCVRKHLSAIKGGRLALAAWPARVLTLAISDVPGDDPAVIASGPTVADPSTLADARAVIARYQLSVSPAVQGCLADPGAETPKPGDGRLAGNTYRLVATPRQMLEAAAAAARLQGVTPLILGDALEGEARESGRVLAGIARSVAAWGSPLAPPCVLLSGGETTVTLGAGGAPAGVPGGRGGRNSEWLLGLAQGLAGVAGVWALAVDTDGIDGTEDNAGAWVAPDTLSRARALGRLVDQDLASHDAWGFFNALGDLVVTGPTHTNVNDFRAILVLPPAG